VVFLDSVPIQRKKFEKMHIVSLAPLLAKIVKRIHEERSLGELFNGK
jgi:phosphoribosylpyrophosphate synthetase